MQNDQQKQTWSYSTLHLESGQKEGRLICGILPAISYLEKSPDDVAFCLLPQTRPGDATNHIQTVLLNAFCYENFIPVIQVDSSKKLADYCGFCPQTQTENSCNCAIILRDTSAPLHQKMNLFYRPRSKFLPTFMNVLWRNFHSQ